MNVNTIDVIKRPVHCFGCGENGYFTLRAIAEKQELSCPQCHATINLSNDAYSVLVEDVQGALWAISA
jgi:hypothetical protein